MTKSATKEKLNNDLVEVEKDEANDDEEFEDFTERSDPLVAGSGSSEGQNGMAAHLLVMRRQFDQSDDSPAVTVKF